MDSLNPLLGRGDFMMGHDHIGLDCQATLDPGRQIQLLEPFADDLLDSGRIECPIV